MFDGGSFVVDADGTLLERSPMFMEDALGEELIEMAGVKEIYKKPKKDDSDDYII